MRNRVACLWVALAGIGFPAAIALAGPLGLPPVPVPADNPMTPEKISLGSTLFNDKRFSSTGEVSCATCHDPAKAFTDSPLKTSEGINRLTGTRNAPTVVNAAFNATLFWDGRSADLEDQSQFAGNRFRNIGVGINRIQDRVPEIAPKFLAAKTQGMDVDVKVLTDPSLLRVRPLRRCRAV